MVNLDRYNRILHIDKTNGTVTVQAGIKLWQLNEALDREGLALANLGSIARQSIAGAISTGTHGTGIGYKILGSQILQLSIILPDGTKVTLHHEKDRELFDLCIVNLGALGVISEVTLRVVPAFSLRDHTFVMHYEEAARYISEMIYEHDHIKMWWLPHTEYLVVYTYNRTDEPPNDSRFRQWFFDELLSVHFYRILRYIGNLHRPWRKPINRLLLKSFSRPLRRIEKSYNVFNVPEPPLHRETEWAFDLSHTHRLLLEYKDLIDNGPHHLNFIQEIRFTQADTYALSPCYNRHTVWLGAYNADNRGWQKLLGDFQQLALKHDGRPHWGKEFTVNSSYLQAHYPRWDDFKKLMLQWDPAGKMQNEYIKKIFYLTT